MFSVRHYIRSLESDKSFMLDMFNKLLEVVDNQSDLIHQYQDIISQQDKQIKLAVEQLHGVCSACQHYSYNHRQGKCKNCKWDSASPACLQEYQDDCWEWSGYVKENLK